MDQPLRTTRLAGTTDLTVRATIKLGLVPDILRVTSYLERLRKTLATIDGVRKYLREAALEPNTFADLIGSFRSIHFFRFAIEPPEVVGQPHRLLLNVTFDGGWEPYMRIIWGPLGTLLDLVFCHCDIYPLAWHSSFDAYMRWVRENEVDAEFFFTDSAATVADASYLRELEEQVRNHGDAANADATAFGLALPAQMPLAVASPSAVGGALRVLRTLASLREHYSTRPDANVPPRTEDGVLLRFTQDLLRDLHGWNQAGLLSASGPYAALGSLYRAELDWLSSLDRAQDDWFAPLPAVRRFVEPERLPTPPLDRAAVQVGIEGAYPGGVNHGVLVLLRITNASQAQTWLGTVPVTSAEAAAATPAPDVFRSLALTYSGLQQLGVPQKTLDGLPREFLEGMEARAGILGDLRANHPDHWRRPRPNWQQPVVPKARPAIELSSVHVLVQLRTAQPPGAPGAGGLAIAPMLVTEINALNTSTVTGLEVLFVQPMASKPLLPGELAGRDGLGFVDGISQPTLGPTAPPRQVWDDEVKTGDLFLGYGNSLDDGPLPPNDSRNKLLDLGSFLVVRKLRQYPQRLDALVAAEAARLRPLASPSQQAAFGEVIKGKMMGRAPDGTALIGPAGTSGNDFDYRSDPLGSICPFQAHIRRANPRERLPRKLPPRIARRGISYAEPQATGATTPPEVGLIFMAYNASLAEQFEVIQRWLTGANSSGQSSAQSDPFLGVPEAGRERKYRFLDAGGQVARIDLGTEPLVTLEWGLYAFAPSLAAITAIAKLDIDEPPAAKDAPPPPPKYTSAALNDDIEVRRPAWKLVQDQPGGVQHEPGVGLLVASPAAALSVLRDKGDNFSTRGYGTRMAASIGHGYLGRDDVGAFDGHQTHAAKVNEEIETIKELQAFDESVHLARTYLKQRLDGAQQLTGKREAQIDIVGFGRSVLAGLCSHWFGLPDAAGVLMKEAPATDDMLLDTQARCPGHLNAASLYVFSVQPTALAKQRAQHQGKLVGNAVRSMLKQAASGGTPLTPLVQDVISTPALSGKPDLQADTVAGLMLGFAPTVLFNLVAVLLAWNKTKSLWQVQHALPMYPATDYATADRVLRGPLIETMKQSSLPHSVWRTAVQDGALGQPGCKAGDTVVVGLGSIAGSAGGDEMMMFGGHRHGPNETTHACPGYKMAMGVMLGCIAALLQAGSLRPNADPRLLTLSEP